MGSTTYILLYFAAMLSSVLTQNCSRPLEGCVRCDALGQQCVKCHEVLVESSRTCRSACLASERETWSQRPDLMGRLCLEIGLFASMGLGGHETAVLIGSLSGIALSMAALIGGIIYVRRRKASKLLPSDDSSDSTLTVTPLNHQERTEFLNWLERLRPEAPTFLAMLNDTRRQAREASSVQAYRPVLRDLFLLLILLNKPPQQLLVPPPDWRKLLHWAERVLRRYKRQSNLTAVPELVTFLPDFNTMSTQVSCGSMWPIINNNDQRRGSILDVEDAHIDTRPPLPALFNRFSFSEADFTDSNWGELEVKSTSAWGSKELLSEAEYAALGFRPQDEITTEL